MKYTGQIMEYSEMGGGSWPQFHDYRGLHGPNKEFWNWDYTINFGKQTKIKRLLIWNDDGEVLYDNSWTYSRENTGKSLANYFPSPKEISSIEWAKILFFNNKLNCEIETDEILEALKPK